MTSPEAGRTRSTRTRSIRTKVAALLLVPLLSLIVLWGYAANVTGREALAQRRYHTLDRQFAPSGQGVLVELGKERLASATFLSASRAAAPATPPELKAQRARLDAAVAYFRRQATSDVARGATNAEMERRVSDVLDALGGLAQIRRFVDARSIDRLTAINDYSSIVDDMHRLYDRLIVIDDSELYNWTLSTRAAGRAMELMQRENALIAGVLVGHGRMTPAEHRMFVEMLGEQRWQWGKQRSLLDPRVYETGTRQVFESKQYSDYKAMEDRIADRTRGPLPIRAAEWQATAQPLVLSVNAMVLANSKRAGEHADDLGRDAYVRLGAVAGLGLLAIVVSVLMSLRFGRGFVRELVGLRGSAEELADRRLPDVVGRLRRNETVDVDAEAPPLRRGRTTEVARLADAFAKVQRTAVDAAVGQAELRAGVSRIFLNIARRNQSLLHRQLTMLDALESRAEADDLEDLFRIDHLTTRMRRHAESLIILSGATPGRGWRRPVRIVDVLRAAIAEIEDYTRATVLTQSEDGLVGAAVTDVVHLLAELLENAASFSPPNTEVRVMADRVGTGFAIEIEDRGLGVKPELLAEANRRLAEPPEFDLVDTDQLGLFVVARLAARHDIDVSLQRSPYGGVTAIVLLPHELVVPAERMADGPEPPDGDGADGPDLDGAVNALGAGAAQNAPKAIEAGAARSAHGAGPRGSGEHRATGAVGAEPFMGQQPPTETRTDANTDVSTGLSTDVNAVAGGGEAAGAGSEARAETVVPLREGTLTGRFATPAADEHEWRRHGPHSVAPAGQAPSAPGGGAGPWGTPDDGPPPPPVRFGDATAMPRRPSVNPWSDDAAEPDDPFADQSTGTGPGAGERTAAEAPGEAAGGGTVGGDPGKGPAQESAGTYAGLPRRVRQENLAPQLRKASAPPPAAGGGTSSGVARSPEEARSLIASIQQGWRRGLASDVGDEGTR
ncbi:sensor histidine kinase [Actinomadura fibrosa]|uniref:histidine kinase n=1 Tax=Actinomadura fibrosa TaxID=111802 RepID=A0ABW2X9L4_9ACTN|nr:sensor histidine kinase [Actinomadura fibrosa]